MEKEKILCAAIWYNNSTELSLSPFGVSSGFVLCGYRHDQIRELYKAMTGQDPSPFHTHEGFLTSGNAFVMRSRAAEIAYNAGQTKTKKWELTSDDIY